MEAKKGRGEARSGWWLLYIIAARTRKEEAALLLLLRAVDWYRETVGIRSWAKGQRARRSLSTREAS